jgi:hypothetical protein
MTAAPDGPGNQGNSGEREVMALPAVCACHPVAVQPPVPGDVRVCASIGPAGELVAVWSQIENLPAVMSWTRSPGGVNFRDPHAPQPVGARVTVHAPALLSVVPIAQLGLANFTVQPLPGGRVLLVAHRCRWRPEGADRNAVVYGSDGSVLAEEVLGDGIGQVLADTAGHIWARYSDEGIYGNYGWGRSDSAEPLGSHGLVRWAPDLRSRWRHPGMASGFGFINDCYALNVDGTTAWACCDAEFPVLRIHDGEISAWRNEVRGAGSLAVDGTTAAFLGRRGRLTVGQLIAGRFRPANEYRVMLPNGSPVPGHAQIIGRGPMLHFLTDDYWYQLDIRDIPQRRDDDNLGSRT